MALALPPLQWDDRAPVLLAGMGAVLVFMSLVAFGLSARARTDRSRAVARDFRARTIGWWLLVAVYLPAVLAGGLVVTAVFAVTALVVWLEFSRCARPAALVGWDLAWAAPLVAAHFAAVADILPVGVGVVLAVVIGVLAWTAWRAGRGRRSARFFWLAAGYGYGVAGLAALPALGLRYGAGWLFFLMVVVPAGDVAQYIAGKLAGRHLLAPVLSPHKTWEGLLGGVTVAVLLAAGLAPLAGLSPAAGAGWGAALALAGTGGGLLMSAVKRRFDVKDFGAWLPGHGGLLDRFDSLVAAAGLAYAGLVVFLR